jgi:hypothetical protein
MNDDIGPPCVKRARHRRFVADIQPQPSYALVSRQDREAGSADIPPARARLLDQLCAKVAAAAGD